MISLNLFTITEESTKTWARRRKRRQRKSMLMVKILKSSPMQSPQRSLNTPRVKRRKPKETSLMLKVRCLLNK